MNNYLTIGWGSKQLADQMLYGYRCSACGFKYDYEETTKIDFKYCIECGTKITKEMIINE